ncbi:MAG TPA: glycosyltransferase [Acidimicrobiales bacterium]|nr:glycosyltransferase [Acidimicrobiales bacterium]
MDGADERVAVVVLTHDRRAQTLETLDRLAALPERPPLIVVDNASGDGTAEAVAGRHPEATLVRLPANLGAAGRNCGAALAPTPYVAFNDDDSWWAPGALGRAADLLDAHPATALVAARVLVREEARLDPSCRAMEASPLRAAGAPGPAVLGFVACGAVVRRGAFLAVGGFRLGYGVGGEEELLALDLAAAGWALAYCADVVAHHHPSSLRPPAAERRRRQARNALRTAWLRRRPAGALRRTAAVAATAVADPAVRGALADAVGDLGWVARERRPVARPLERDVALLDGAGAAP